MESEVQRLHRLEARLPAVRHYLNLFPKLVEYVSYHWYTYTYLTRHRQHTQMQQRLASLGFAMSFEPIPNYDEPLPIDEIGGPVQENTGDMPMDSLRTGSSHTVGRCAHNTGFGGEMVEEAPTSAQRQRPSKRFRVESPTCANNIHTALSSRDMMPPPFKPLSKIKSMRKIIPNLRNKLTNARSSGKLGHKVSSDMDIQMYDNGQWEVVDERAPTRYGPQSDAPYMTGALPVEDHPVNEPAQSRFLSGLGIHNNVSNFTFESPSALKMPSQRSGNLPAEPSYIRLLDGLGQHTGLDLGLDDLRNRDQGAYAFTHPPEQYLHRPRLDKDPQQSLRSTPPKLQTQNHKKQLNFGHAFLEQSPVNANANSAYLGGDHDKNDVAIMNNSQGRTITNPITPAPARFQRPPDEVDNVVSPFFGSSSRRTQPLQRSQFTEPDISSSRSAAYQSRHHMPSLDTDWREPRSLNGLSFFDSPVNERNERIDWRRETRPQEYTTSLPQLRGRCINSQGFLVKPDAARSPDGHGTYGPLGQSLSLQTSNHSATSFPSFNPPSQSQATRLPSAMPFMIPGSSPRRRPQAQNVGLPGVRSSHRSRAHVSGGVITSSARPVFPSTIRRVIRR